MGEIKLKNNIQVKKQKLFFKKITDIFLSFNLIKSIIFLSFFFLFFVVFFNSGSNNAEAFVCGVDTITDSESNVYDTVVINSQCWMAENMNIGTRIDGSGDQADNATLEKYCYDNLETNCNIYGGLYQWNESMQYSAIEGAQGICPADWHIPTDAEQYALENYLKDSEQTCDASRIDIWDCSTAGTKLSFGGLSGFEALFTGGRWQDGSFQNIGTNANFWSSSSGASPEEKIRRSLNSSRSDINRNEVDNLSGISVRCLADHSILTLAYTAGTGGTISGMATQTINEGDDGTPVEAIPDSGYHFVKWSDDSIQNPRTDLNVAINISVTAEFAENHVNANWLSKLPGAINHNKVSGTSNLTNFPVLISNEIFPDDIYSHTKTNGEDLRFTIDEAGTQPLAFEVVNWNTTDKTGEVWINFPIITYDQDTSFYVWYNNPSAEALPADHTYGRNNVWNSNYKMVQHLKDTTSSTISDSTININNGTKLNSDEPIQTTGKILNAQNFDGTNDVINITDANSLDLSTDFTIDLWFSPDNQYSATSDYIQGLIDKGDYKIFLDKSDGKLKAELNNSNTTWATSYNGGQEQIRAMAVYNGKLYAGQGNGTGDGDVYVYDGTTWSLSYNGAQEQIISLVVYDGKLYAGQGSGTGDGDVLVFDGTTWSVSYNGSQEVMYLMAVYNGKLYVGQGTGAGDGDILVYDGTTWSVSYNGTQEYIISLAVYNGKLYAGQGLDAGDGDVLVYDGTTWSVSYDGTQEQIISLVVYNGKLYAGQGLDAGDGDVLVFDGTTWSVSYDGAQEQFFSLTVYNGKLYAGQGNGTGDGDVYVYDGTTWTKSYEGAQETIFSSAIYNGKLYAGQGSGTGDGDVFVLNSGEQISSNLNSWNANNFYKATLSKTGTTANLYINGNLETTQTVNATTNTNSLELLLGSLYGTRETGAGEGLFNGSIDEIRISSSALSADWISSEYRNENTPPSFVSIDNTTPNAPTNLGQFQNDESTAIANNGITEENNVKLKASITDPDNPEALTLFFEVQENTNSFSSPITPSIESPCVTGTEFASCSSKIWSATSGYGDYSSTAYDVIMNITGLSDATHYKWQVNGCDDSDICTGWTQFNAIIPNFSVIDRYTLIYSAGPNGTISGTTTQVVLKNEDATEVIAVPNTGYHFVRWSDNVMTASRTDLDVIANISATAEFAIDQFTLTYIAGSNGTVSGSASQTIDYGSDGTAVTAVPNVGYYFVSWSDGIMTPSRTDLDITEDLTATASFAIYNYTLTYTAGTNGTISGISPQSVDYGGSGAEITAIPDTGYHFVKWSDDSIQNPRTDINVTADITVSAKFDLDYLSPSWLSKLPGAINHNKVSGTSNLTNFPVLISNEIFPDDIYSHTKTNGEDLRFTIDEAGTQPLAFEVVNWNTTDKTGEVWINFPTITYDQDTSFYVWYNNPSAEALPVDHTYGRNNVWNLNYKMVQHLKDTTSSTISDSTININNGTKLNSDEPIQTTGKISNAQNFDGTNDVINITDANSLDLSTDFTIDLWFSPDNQYSATSDYIQGLIDKGDYKIFLDKSDGKLKAELNNSNTTWATSYNGGQEQIRAMAVYNGKLYVGQGSGTGDGDVYVYDGISWTLSYNGAQEYIISLAVYNGKLYAGQGSGTGDGDVLVFDGTTWSMSYDGTQEQIISLVVYNGKLYAGQGLDAGDGDVLVFDGTTWSVSYDGAQEQIYSLITYNGKLYAGQASGAGDGDVLVFDGTAWVTSYDGTQEAVFSLAVYDGKLYAGQGSGTGDGDVLVFNGTAWTTSYDGTQEAVYSLAVYNGKLYAGQGNGTGDGDVYVYNGTSWAKNYEGAQEYITSSAVYNGKLYAGQGAGSGDGDVFVLNSGEQISSNITSWNANNFYKATLSKTGTTANLYINGNLETTQTVNATTNTNSLELLLGSLYGTRETGAGEGLFNGSIDEVRISSSVLSANWISAEYRNENTPPAFVSINNTIPNAPTNLGQFENDEITVIANEGITEENNVKLKASITDPDNPESLTLFFEVQENTNSFSSPITPSIESPCVTGTEFASCSSKIWSATSNYGDYSSATYDAVVNIAGLPYSTSYKWQVKACDDSDFCTGWTQFNATTPNFSIINQYTLNYEVSTKGTFISIDHTKIDEDLTDFPLTVFLSQTSGLNSVDVSAIFDEIGTESTKLRIDTGTGDQCYVEIESWDHINERAVLHVKVPYVSSTEDTILNFYKTEDPDNSNYVGITGTVAAQNVWSNGYGLVMHMGQDPTVNQILDSTSNGNNGTAHSMASNDLQINSYKKNYLDFDGVNDYISIPHSSSYAVPGDFSVLFFMYKYAESYDNEPYPYWWSKASALYTSYSSMAVHGLWHFRDGYIRFEAAGVGSFNAGSSNPDTDHSKWIAWDYDSSLSGGFTKLYRDGVQVNTTTRSVNASWGTNPMYLGVGEYERYATVRFAEYRMSTKSRSQAWIKATNLSLRDGLVNYSDPDVYTVGIGGVITGTNPQFVKEGYNGTEVTAVPNAGYHFVSWSDGVLTESRTDMNITESMDVTANFESSHYTLDYSIEAKGAFISIDHTKIDEDLIDFPLTVFLSETSGLNIADVSNVFDEIGTESTKLRVDTATGDQCYVEIESWDNVLEKAVLHIKVPNISSTEDTVLSFYKTDDPNNSNYTNTSGNRPEVWDSNFVGVYHMNNDPSLGAGAIKDSTINARHGTSVGTMTSGDLVDGKIGKAIDFDGSDDGINLTDYDFTNQITVEGWGYLTSESASNAKILNKALDSYSDPWNVFSLEYTPSIHKFDLYLPGGSGTSFISESSTGSLNKFAYLAGTYNGSSIKLYSSGVLNSSGARTGSILASNQAMTIGYNNKYGSDDFRGKIDEVRISSIARSDSWIKATNYSLEDDLITYTDIQDFSIGAMGTITGTNPQTVEYTQNGTEVTAVPNAGYHFTQWSDGVLTASRTDTNVVSDITVTANFEQDAPTAHTLTYTAGSNGSISGISPQTVNEGEDGSSVQALPDSGYHFVKWSDNSTQNPRTDTNVTTDISVTAEFALTTISITCDASIIMANITGTGQSDLATNMATCNIDSNNPDGYSLTWKASTNEMISNTEPTDLIPAYIPTVEGTPETWLIDSATSAWGGHLGKDSTIKNTTIWGTEDTYTNGKWINLKTTDTEIISNNTNSQVGGDDEILYFGSEIGQNKQQPAGQYEVSITVTALTL